MHSIFMDITPSSSVQPCTYNAILNYLTPGVGQGIQWSVGAIAAILGPLWAGATLHMYYVLMGVPLGILAGVVVSKNKKWSEGNK